MTRSLDIEAPPSAAEPWNLCLAPAVFSQNGQEYLVLHNTAAPQPSLSEIDDVPFPTRPRVWTEKNRMLSLLDISGGRSTHPRLAAGSDARGSSWPGTTAPWPPAYILGGGGMQGQIHQ